MRLKPSKGMKVIVNATKEVVFGEEEVTIKVIDFWSDRARSGLLTGRTLAGYCEVMMTLFDGKKHWYPMQNVEGEHGEKIEEEEIRLEADDDTDDELE